MLSTTFVKTSFSSACRISLIALEDSCGRPAPRFILNRQRASRFSMAPTSRRSPVLERLAKSSYARGNLGLIASGYPAAYHYRFMLTAQSHLSNPRNYAHLAIIAFLAAVSFASRPVRAQESTEILPLSQVRAGMHGYAYTIFAGDQVEKFDLEVIGVLDNFLGPTQSIILVELKGPKVEHT